MQDVARTANGAFVSELAADPRLAAWLDENGLSVAEAARVQPCYNCPSFDPAAECACSLPLDALVVGTFTTDLQSNALVIAVDAVYGSATAQPGSMIDTWVMGPAFEQEGVQVLLSEDGDGSFHVLYPVEGSSVITSSCTACPPITFAPTLAPLDAFIAVAEGAVCHDTCAALPDWGVQAGDGPCGPSSTAAGSSTVAGPSSSSAATGGGSSGVDGADPDAAGCGCATTPIEGNYVLLWALAAGVAVARRRSRRETR